MPVAVVNVRCVGVLVYQPLVFMWMRMRFILKNRRMFMKVVPVLVIMAVLVMKLKMRVQVDMSFTEQEEGTKNHNRKRNNKKDVWRFSEH